MGLSSMFASLYDTLFAPPGALPGDDFISSPLDPTSLMPTHIATDCDIEWHNGFGTLNDFEVPASGSTTFDTFDSSSQGDMFSSDWP